MTKFVGKHSLSLGSSGGSGSLGSENLFFLPKLPELPELSKLIFSEFSIFEKQRGKMDNKSNSAIKFLAIILCLTAFVWTANAQKKKPATTTKKTTPATASTTNTAEIKAGAEKVSTQVKNISKFIFVLGGVAKDIEAIDADIRTGKITRQTTIDQNVKNKQAVVQAIRNLRAGLIALEEEFRTKTALKLYSVRIDGISNAVADAESQAAGGQLTESGKTLLFVLERLSDALVALP